MLIIVFSTDPNGPAGPPGDSGNVVGGVSLSSPHKKRPKRVLLLHVYLVSVPNDNLFYFTNTYCYYVYPSSCAATSRSRWPTWKSWIQCESSVRILSKEACSTALLASLIKRTMSECILFEYAVLCVHSSPQNGWMGVGYT